MLREILAITGKPGLFKIISHSSKLLLVEELGSKKRFPASARDKVVSLGDIAMYTDSGDKPLGEILDLVYEHNDGKKIDVKELVKTNGLRDEFEAILPAYDKDRVYPTDIKKLFTWYNILIDNGYTKFTEEVKEAENVEKEVYEEEKKEEEQQRIETAADEAQAVAAEEE
ncbi:MAG: DUF5606 domain-containing protein [Muribaculaceae bacterium]|nr:DUF5606 domain-containing protein [Muribaculaceae bacterium]